MPWPSGSRPAACRSGATRPSRPSGSTATPASRSDKSPYKPYASASFPWVEAETVGPGGYFHFQPGEMYIGGGMWHPEPARLAAWRAMVAGDPAAVHRAIEDARFVATFGDVHGDSLKRVPAGFPGDHPDAELLKLKDVTFGRRLSDDEALSAGLPDILADAFADAVPVFRLLAGLGADLAAQRRRARNSDREGGPLDRPGRRAHPSTMTRRQRTLAAFGVLVAVMVVAGLVLGGALRPGASGQATTGPGSGASGDGSSDPGASTITPEPTPVPTPGHEVYGYVPYWEMDDTIAAHVAGTDLTTLALFSVTNLTNGTLEHRPERLQADHRRRSAGS